jgi:hypothetical protein
VIDAYADDQPIEGTIDLIRRARPRWVLLSSTPSYLFWRCPPLEVDLVARYASAIEALGISVLVLGPHGTSDPAWTLARTHASYVFRGEVEALLPFSRIEAALHSGRSVPGLCSREALVPTAPEPVALSRASYALMGALYPAHTWLPEMAKQLDGVAGALVEAARGCAWDCAFCFRDGFRRKLRLKAIEHLSAELDELVAKGVRYVYFIDETFGTPWHHYSRVIELLGERGLIFGMQTRPDVWSPERIAALRDGGCIYAEIGLEAMRSDHLVKLGKFKNAGCAIESVDVFREVILFVGANVFDFGIPELKLVRSGSSAMMDHGGARPLAFMPYPGTPMGEDALKSIAVDGASWDVARALHALFAIENRLGLGSVLRRWRWLRRLLVKAALQLGTRATILGLSRTRFELRTEVRRDPK